MRRSGRLILVLGGLASSLAAWGQSPVDATFDPATGAYRIVDRASGWTLAGGLGQAAKLREGHGRDGRGAYRELSFDWREENVPLQGAIRVYEGAPAVLFRLRYPEGRSGKSVVFPRFTAVPSGLHGFSYRDTAFSPGHFGLADTSTPWLFFDDQARAMVFSPASNFLLAKMVGDGKTNVGMALNARLKAVPKGATQDSLLVFAPGINAAWAEWGASLRGLYGRKPAPSDSITADFGYWTDNGGKYYYNYDVAKGYPGTLIALRDRYRAEGLPLGYLQLDSWWYRKLSDGVSGEPVPGHRNPRLPAGDWNRYGGVLEYRADTTLFPNGLDAFRRDLGLPFIVHGRWIDQESPLRKRYAISGVGPVDPRYWNDTADYLADSGVICYEQDWMDHIVSHSPEMSSVAGVADRFADGMAEAMARKGLSMQYCMATPRFVLQGVKYPNLATVRTSPDRFEPGKWAEFVYGAPLVAAVGALPWSDVFMSRETGNLTLSLLSAGPVGTGDAMGEEDAANIRRAARADGLLVKPDRPLMPTDATYLSEANKRGEPFVGETETDHDGLRTRYFFAFARGSEGRTAHLEVGRAYLYDFLSGEGRFVDGAVEAPIGKAGYAYVMAAPIARSGVALLGDLGKLVPMGKARIASVVDGAEGLRVRVSFAKGEDRITLEGACAREPKVRGSVQNFRYDPRTQRFAFEVLPNSGEVTIDGRA